MPRYFTADEIESSYRYQEHFGRRLYHPLRCAECFLGKKEFVASYGGKEFPAPCSLILETVRHLREIFKLGAAKYLIPLDLDHAHLLIPSDLWEKKYRPRPGDEVLRAILREPKLGALYHAAEYLTVVEPKINRINVEAKRWKEKRNILGLHNRSPVIILPPDSLGFAVAEPEQYRSYGAIYFLASRLGELTVVMNGKPVSFDISFDDDFGTAGR